MQGWEACGLEGRIVRLEPLALEHEEGLFAAAQHPEIWTWMSISMPESPEAFRAWLDEALAASTEGVEAAFVTLDARTGRPLGSTRYLALAPEHRRLEIGWTWLNPAAWGTGANTEAKLLQLEHAFRRIGCLRVEFKTDARNERARRALEALPSRFEGIFRKHMLVRGGERRDSAWYAITDDEWPDVYANLLARLGRS